MEHLQRQHNPHQKSLLCSPFAHAELTKLSGAVVRVECDHDLQPKLLVLH
jgi:hypothetical protein